MPDAERDSEPQRKNGECDGRRGRFVAQENPADGCCVDGHGDGSGDHGAGFYGCVEFAVVVDGEAEGGQRDGRCCTEEAGEAFGRKMSPRMAKRLTTVPPMRKRRSRLVMGRGVELA